MTAIANLHLPRTFTNTEGYVGAQLRPADWTMLRRELHVQAAQTSGSERDGLMALAARLTPDRHAEVHLSYADMQRLLQQVALATIARPDASDRARRVAVLGALMGLLSAKDQDRIRDEARAMRRAAAKAQGGGAIAGAGRWPCMRAPSARMR
jgi:hypothetical protein